MLSDAASHYPRIWLAQLLDRKNDTGLSAFLRLVSLPTSIKTGRVKSGFCAPATTGGLAASNNLYSVNSRSILALAVQWVSRSDESSDESDKQRLEFKQQADISSRNRVTWHLHKSSRQWCRIYVNT